MVVHLVEDLIGSTRILSVPRSARFCLGWFEFGRRGWAAGQDGGTPKSKSIQPRSTSTWDALYRVAHLGTGWIIEMRVALYYKELLLCRTLNCMSTNSVTRPYEQPCRLYVLIPYRGGRPICRKVLKIMFWEVPLAGGPLL